MWFCLARLRKDLVFSDVNNEASEIQVGFRGLGPAGANNRLGGELANGPKIAFLWLDHSKKAARPIEPVLETAGPLPGSHLG